MASATAPAPASYRSPLLSLPTPEPSPTRSNAALSTSSPVIIFFPRPTYTAGSTSFSARAPGQALSLVIYTAPANGSSFLPSSCSKPPSPSCSFFSSCPSPVSLVITDDGVNSSSSPSPLRSSSSPPSTPTSIWVCVTFFPSTPSASSSPLLPRPFSSRAQSSAG